MKSRYPMRPLSDALNLSLDVVDVQSTQRYRIAGVYGFGRGLFERPTILGTETKYTRLTRLHEGTLIFSKLKAFEGAIAMVDARADGAFASAEFPTFRPSQDADSQYLAHVCRWPDFWALIADHSKGVGARRERLHPRDLLDTKIPLPDIEEQRRIAAHLDRTQLAAEQIKRLRTSSEMRTSALFASLATQPQLAPEERRNAGWTKRRLGDLMTPASQSVPVDVASEYPNIGILSFGRGVFLKPPIAGDKTSAKTLNRVRTGQFIYSRLFAFEGAYAFVPPEHDGYFVSNEFPAFDVDADISRAEFVAASLRSSQQWQALASSSKGLGLRRQRIQVEALLRHELWFPPIDEQLRILDGLRRVVETRSLLASSSRLSAALLPSALNRAFAGLA